MDQIETIERAYDQLLRARREETRDYLEQQRDALGWQHIDITGYHLPLRPIFFSAAQLQRLEQTLGVFWGALLKLFQRTFDGDVRKVAGLIQLPEAAQECLERYCAPERAFAQLYGRADAFVWGQQIRFIEQNITSGPGGLARTDLLTRFFDGFPAMRALRERLPARPLTPLDAYAALFDPLLRAGKTIGYVDAVDPETGGPWDDEGLRFLELLDERGIHLINLTGREMTLRDDGVYVEGQRLDYAYRGVAAAGIWFRMQELEPLFQAASRGQLDLFMSPFEMIFFDKMLLPYLSDEQLNGFLAPQERQLLDAVVPWTRFLREYTTSYQGAAVDIPQLCRQRKDDLVIKKGNSLASQAVVIGAECSDEQWAAQLDRGLGEGNWVVQELVAPPRVSLPYMEGGELVWADVLSMPCPFVVRGKICGVVGRTSIPEGGRVLVAAGMSGSQAGIRTTVCVP